MLHQLPHDGNLCLHMLVTDTLRGKTSAVEPLKPVWAHLSRLCQCNQFMEATFFADLAGEHAVTFAGSSGHPGLVEDALLPGFDQLHQVQVGLGKTRSLQTETAEIVRS